MGSPPGRQRDVNLTGSRGHPRTALGGTDELCGSVFLGPAGPDGHQGPRGWSLIGSPHPRCLPCLLCRDPPSSLSHRARGACVTWKHAKLGLVSLLLPTCLGVTQWNPKKASAEGWFSFPRRKTSAHWSYSLQVNKVSQGCLEPEAPRDLLETQESQVTEPEKGARALLCVRVHECACVCAFIPFSSSSSAGTYSCWLARAVCRGYVS